MDIRIQETTKLVAEMRKLSGLTTMQLAAKMKSHVKKVHRLEQGPVLPSLRLLDEVADACGFEIHLVAVHKEDKRVTPVS
jgi:ribosome-binding protein aMBF1 (putative translation factor)